MKNIFYLFLIVFLGANLYLLKDEVAYIKLDQKTYKIVLNSEKSFESSKIVILKEFKRKFSPLKELEARFYLSILSFGGSKPEEIILARLERGIPIYKAENLNISCPANEYLVMDLDENSGQCMDFAKMISEKIVSEIQTTAPGTFSGIYTFAPHRLEFFCSDREKIECKIINNLFIGEEYEKLNVLISCDQDKLIKVLDDNFANYLAAHIPLLTQIQMKKIQKCIQRIKPELNQSFGEILKIMALPLKNQ